jgi:hypothetical protein
VVHHVHNFPDILHLTAPANHCLGTLLAGLSGVVAAALPLLLTWIVFSLTSKHPSDAAVKLQILTFVFLMVVIFYAAACGGGSSSVFFVHRCMYTTLTSSLLVSWALSALEGASSS